MKKTISLFVLMFAVLISVSTLVPVAAINGTITWGNSSPAGQPIATLYTSPTTVATPHITLNTTQSLITYIKIAATPYRDEKIAAHQDANGELHVLKCTDHCDAAGDWAIIGNYTPAVKPNSVTRTFDIAYETLSGNFMIVYSGNFSLKDYYCSYNGTNWTPVANCDGNFSPGSGNEINFATKNASAWLRLVPTNNTNELFLARLDDGGNFSGGRWDGSAWVNLTNFTNTGTAATTTTQSFDIVVEAASGNAIMVFDKIGADGTVHYRQFTKASLNWSAVDVNGIDTGAGNNNWIELASHPRSNRMSMIIADSESDAHLYIWKADGSSERFTSHGTDPIDGAIETTTGKDVATVWAFENDTGNATALFSYTDSNVATQDVVCWHPTSNFSAVTADVGGSSTDDPDTVVYFQAPRNGGKVNGDSDEVFALRGDIFDDLVGTRWTGLDCGITNFTRVPSSGTIDSSLSFTTDNSAPITQWFAYDLFDYCGQTLTASKTLIHKYDTLGSGSCFNFGADNIVLDCNNFVLKGDGTGTGINATGRTNITIQNCVIENFDRSIHVFGSNSSFFINNTERNASRTAINITAANSNFFNRNFATSRENTAVIIVNSSNMTFWNLSAISINAGGILLGIPSAVQEGASDSAFIDSNASGGFSSGIQLAYRSDRNLFLRVMSDKNGTSGAAIEIGIDSDRNNFTDVTALAPSADVYNIAGGAFHNYFQNIIGRAEGQEVLFLGGDNTTFINYTFYFLRKNALQPAIQLSGADNNTFLNGIIYTNWSTGLLSSGNNDNNNFTDLIIIQNTTSGSLNEPIRLDDATDTNTRFVNLNITADELTSLDRMLFSGRNLSLINASIRSNRSIVIKLQNANGTIIRDSTLISNTSNAVLVSQGFSSVFVNSTFISYSRDALLADNSSNNTIMAGVNITSNNSNALHLVQSGGWNVTGSILTSNTAAAVFIRLLSESNTFTNAIFRSNVSWFMVNESTATNLTNATFDDFNGSITFIPTVNISSYANISRLNLNISPNRAFLNSTNLSFMNTSAQIALRTITFSNPRPTIDSDDDGTFSTCPSNICTEVSFSSNVFIFNVTGFTAYSSEETPLECGANITATTNMTSSLTQTGGGNCISFGADNIILDCQNYNLTGSNAGVGVNVTMRRNATIRNCFVTNFTIDIVLQNTNDSFLINNTAVNTSDGTAILLNNSNNNTLTNNLGEAPSGSTARGIHLNDANRNALLNNRGWSASAEGIRLDFALWNNLTNSFGNGSSLSSRGILLSNSSNNSFTNTTSLLSAGAGISLGLNTFSINNTFTNATIDSRTAATSLDISGNSSNNTFRKADITSGASSTAIALSITSSHGNTFGNLTLFANNTWIRIRTGSENNTVQDITFNSSNGSMRITPLVPLSNLTTIDRNNLNFSFNRAFLNSTNLSFLNQSAQVTLMNISFTDPEPTIDAEDDGTAIACPSDICTEISFDNGVFVFNVTGFTSYRSQDAYPLCGSNISQSTNLSRNINQSVAGSCLSLIADNIVLDCQNYNLTGEGSGIGINVTDRANVTIRNCIVINFGISFHVNGTNRSFFINNTGRNASANSFNLVSSHKNLLDMNNLSSLNSVNSAGLLLLSSNDTLSYNTTTFTFAGIGVNITTSSNNTFVGTNATANSTIAIAVLSRLGSALDPFSRDNTFLNVRAVHNTSSLAVIYLVQTTGVFNTNITNAVVEGRDGVGLRIQAQNSYLENIEASANRTSAVIIAGALAINNTLVNVTATTVGQVGGAASALSLTSSASNNTILRGTFLSHGNNLAQATISLSGSTINNLFRDITAKGNKSYVLAPDGTNNTFINLNATNEDNSTTTVIILQQTGNHTFRNITVRANSSNAVSTNFWSQGNSFFDCTLISNTSNALSITHTPNNFFGNCTIFSSTGAAAVFTNSSNNTFFNVTIRSNTSTALDFSQSSLNNVSNSEIISNTGTAIVLDTVSDNNSFANVILRTNSTWLSVNGSSGNNMTNITFDDANGSITLLPTVNISSLATVSLQQNLNLSFNRTFMNSTNLSFMNVSAQIRLNNITFTNPKPMYDPEDDSTYIDCPSNVCTEVSFSNSIFIYNVTGFTSYSSAETAAAETNCGDTIISSTTLTRNLSLNLSGACINIGADNIFLNCNGMMLFGNGTNTTAIQAENRTGILIENCTIRNFGIGVLLSNLNHSLLRRSWLHNNTNATTITGNFPTALSYNITLATLVLNWSKEALTVTNTTGINLSTSNITNASTAINFSNVFNGTIEKSLIAGLDAGIAINRLALNILLQENQLFNSTIGLLAEGNNLTIKNANFTNHGSCFRLSNATNASFFNARCENSSLGIHILIGNMYLINFSGAWLNTTMSDINATANAQQDIPGVFAFYNTTIVNVPGIAIVNTSINMTFNNTNFSDNGATLRYNYFNISTNATTKPSFILDTSTFFVNGSSSSQYGVIALNDSNITDMNRSSEAYFSSIACNAYRLFFNQSLISAVSALRNSSFTVARDFTTQGDACSPPGLCENVRCSNSMLTFNITGFSSFGVQNNTPPTTPVLLSPTNGNLTMTERRPTFIWNASDLDGGDNITYEINITHGVCPNVFQSGINVTNFTVPFALCTNGDDDNPYNWTVRAFDGTHNSSLSETFNFTITAVAAINLTTNVTNFGDMNVTNRDNTTDDSPPPFVVQNDGNVLITIRVNASGPLWLTQPLNTQFFQYKVDNTTSEPESFNVTGSQLTFTNMTDTNKTAIIQLNYTDATDTAEVDILVRVPSDEPSGSKSSRITLLGEYAE